MTTKHTAAAMCRACGKPLIGRRDKKYCDDYCRSRFNNRLNNVDEVPVKAINQVLRKNRQILHAVLLAVDKSTCRITGRQLQERGFNFHYFTHLYHTNKGDTYHYCYDYGYRVLEENWYMIVKIRKYPAIKKP